MIDDSSGVELRGSSRTASRRSAAGSPTGSRPRRRCRSSASRSSPCASRRSRRRAERREGAAAADARGDPAAAPTRRRSAPRARGREGASDRRERAAEPDRARAARGGARRARGRERPPARRGGGRGRAGRRPRPTTSAARSAAIARRRRSTPSRPRACAPSASAREIQAAMPAAILLALAAARARRPARHDRAPDDHARPAHAAARSACAAAPGDSRCVPRCVLVERATEYRELLARHGTREQARFFLARAGSRSTRSRSATCATRRRARGVVAADPGRLAHARASSAPSSTASCSRAEDVVVALGQDGLVANVAKYLDGQPVIGLNPDPERYAGVLVTPRAAGDRRPARRRRRGPRRDAAAARWSRARARRRPALRALNEIFVGHARHQSARYTLTRRRARRAPVLVGADRRHRHRRDRLGGEHQPRARGAARAARPGDRGLAWFVREAWPSRATGTALTAGLLEPPATLEITCELGDGAVAFGDGIEADRLQHRLGPGDHGRRRRHRAGARRVRS